MDGDGSNFLAGHIPGLSVGRLGRKFVLMVFVWGIVWLASGVGPLAGTSEAPEEQAEGVAQAGRKTEALDAAVAPRSKSAISTAFLIMLVLAGVTSAAETAIFSLNKIDLLRIRQHESKSARALLYLLDRPNDTLTTILILNNLVSVGLSLAASALTEAFFTGITAGGFAAAAFGTTAVLLVFGEVLPKCVGNLKAQGVAQFVAWPTAGISLLLAPVTLVIKLVIRGIFRAMGVAEPKPTDEISEEELKAVMQAGEISNVLEEDERDMIEGVFELRHTYAEEIMIPRMDVTAFPDTLTQEEMLASLRATPRNRVVIYKDSLDHPVGFVLVKEVLLNPGVEWRTKIRGAMMIPPRARLLDLLRKFRMNSMKMALVLDEYGGVAGMVTLHDLLEEIVGDITERHETTSAEFQKIEGGRWLVQGGMNLRELAEELEVEFPEDMGATLGGYIMNSLGHVPVPGNTVEHAGLRFKVVRMAGRRVVQVEIEPTDGLTSSISGSAGVTPEAGEGA